MSYDHFVGFLLLYLEIDNAKTVCFDFAVKKHEMSSTDIYIRLKKLNTVFTWRKTSFSYFMSFCI